VLVVVVMFHILMTLMVVGAIPSLLIELFAFFARCFAVFTVALDSIPKPHFGIVNASFATHSTVVIRACWKCGSYQADYCQHCNTKKPDRTSHMFSCNLDFYSRNSLTTGYKRSLRIRQSWPFNSSST
jgi:hypothetical protein